MTGKTVSSSRTVVTEIIEPNDANFLGKAFGGAILARIDLCAYATASRYAGTICVTASFDRVEFHEPIEVGELVTLEGYITYVGRTSLEVTIEVYAENLIGGTRRHTNTARVTMVALRDGKPSPVPRLEWETREDKVRFLEGSLRRSMRTSQARDLEARLAELGGEDVKHGYKTIKLPAYVSARVKDNNEGSIGVVTVAGTIVDGKAPAGTAGGDTIAQIIDEAVREGGLKALVVRVDSPGGSVLASERIRQAILNAKAKDLPIVVSMGSVAASGGYWVSTPADFIYAEPSTITGSIGVFGILPSFEGTLQKLGIGADGIKTTPLSGEPDLFKGPSDEADRLIQASIESIYRRFLTIVAQSRRRSPADIDRIAQGRVWDGGTARQLGLVDGFGGLDEAIAKAGALAKVENPVAEVRYLERPESFEEQLLELLADDRSGRESDEDAFAALAPDRGIARALADLRSVLAGPRIQVRCLECPATAPARVTAEDRTFLAGLRDWLF